MSRRAAAFAPGHITGFFEIHDAADDPAQVGSRGAGFSISLGVHSSVEILDEGVPGVDLRIDGRPAEAATTRRALALLTGREPLVLRVEQRVELPVSQGFGMSAAGALSAALALARLLGRTRDEAVAAAHTAEVMQRTGLGDVVGAAQGGFEVRLRPGLPPHGLVQRWEPVPPVRRVALVAVADAVLTKRVLADPARRAAVNAVGGRLVDSFATAPTIDGFVAVSRRFAHEAGLSSPAVEEALARAGPRSAQAQLGASVFAFDPEPAQLAALGELGLVHQARIDPRGARAAP